MGCIYGHPHMNLDEFNGFYLNWISYQRGKKAVFLFGDFNIDL